MKIFREKVTNIFTSKYGYAEYDQGTIWYSVNLRKRYDEKLCFVYSNSIRIADFLKIAKGCNPGLDKSA